MTVPFTVDGNAGKPVSVVFTDVMSHDECKAALIRAAGLAEDIPLDLFGIFAVDGTSVRQNPKPKPNHNPCCSFSCTLSRWSSVYRSVRVWYLENDRILKTPFSFFLKKSSFLSPLLFCILQAATLLDFRPSLMSLWSVRES